ncbi:hypothetical protein [Thiocystis violascens]|uniref:Uncharacterized protein n=1 Tax=Thiocystis violascens (strain ATCC 17096 / DSM 198 / 6111) TaxID=765911 RepID=I3Y8E5_THIV6|nr:hypothetical protein [Thiocystis violascens]AFL73263.1 hypothetical protein Thivi_1240 [Thiocystis violascens DSM 198]
MNKLLLILIFFLPGLIKASPVFYTFEGSLTQIQEQHFDNNGFNNGPTSFAFPSSSVTTGLAVGQSVFYVFEVDFDYKGIAILPDGSISTAFPYYSSTRTYFYAKYLEGSVPEISTYGIEDNYLGMENRYGVTQTNGVGRLLGGLESNRIEIAGNQHVQDWTLGKVLSGQNIAYLSDNLREVYQLSLELSNIFSVNPVGVPLPATLALLVIGFVILIPYILPSTNIERAENRGQVLQSRIA